MNKLTKILYLALILIINPDKNLYSETYNLGGMYTYHYHDGRYADWGDYAREAAFLAIEEIIVVIFWANVILFNFSLKIQSIITVGQVMRQKWLRLYFKTIF